ncbi:MAG TPA: DUF4231 domain-containing protein [Rhizomicrobium sp.]|nr:DUF4231 domain-containing protein [Rhizomicrobium sp.]
MQSNEARSTQGPPRPCVALRFGVSGHRVLAEADGSRIRDSLLTLFRDARQTLQELSASHRELFAGDVHLRLVSAIAEGADRIAAEAALASGFALDCPLPFAREFYEADFATPQSRKAFHALLARAANVFELEETRGVDDDRAYEAVGLMTLRQCDILIAVWNGKPAEGRGGTAEIVSRAIDSNIPIIWIHSEKNVPPKLLRADPMGPRDPALIPADDLSPDIYRALLRAMILPPPDPPSHVHRPPSRRLRDYRCERQVSFTFTIFYALLQALLFVRMPRLCDFRVPDFLANAKAQWQTYWRLMPAVSPHSRDALSTVLEPAFGWADGLASYYVRVYRSSYVLSFVLAAGAVFVSLLGLWEAISHGWLVLIELAVMSAIIAIVSAGALRGWHERWIDYRHLAELLRHMRVLTLTGSSTLEIRRTAHTGEDARDSGAAWVGWYYRAIVREVGMVGARADAKYASDIAQLVRQTELAEQIAYHKSSEGVSHRIDHRLDMLGMALFGATAALCLVFAIAHFLLGWDIDKHAKIETFFTAFLPALGAAVYGIRVQGEFGRIARRARSMGEQLARISASLESEAVKGTLTLSRVSFLTEMAAQAMALDVTDWRFVFREKPLTLPA